MKIMLCPYSVYDFAGREAWFADCARRGLFIKAYFASLFFMESGEPEKLRFHLEAPLGSDLQEKLETQQALFEDCGWKYLCTLSGNMPLFCTNDPNADEPYTDDDSRAESLQALDKALKRSWRTSCILWGALIAFLVFLGLGSGLDLGARAPLILISIPLTAIVWFAVSLLRRFRDWKRLHRLRQNLLEGRRAVPEKPINVPLEVCYWLLCLAAAFTVFCNYGLLPKPAPPELPSIAELEDTEGHFTRSPAGKGFGVTTIWSPMQYELYQSFCPDADPDSRSHLKTTYFRIMPILARGVAGAQLDVYRTYNQSWEFTEAQYPGADFVILARVKGEEAYSMAAIASGSRLVVYSYYGGPANLAHALDVLAAPVLKGGAK